MSRQVAFMLLLYKITRVCVLIQKIKVHLCSAHLFYCFIHTLDNLDIQLIWIFFSCEI